MAKAKSSRQRVPESRHLVTTVTFFRPDDVDTLLREAGIAAPADLHYAAKDDPRYSGPKPEKPPPGTYADSLAERCAKNLHMGLRRYVEWRLAQEFYPSNSVVRGWAERIVSHTGPLLEELGFDREELPGIVVRRPDGTTEVLRPEGGERWIGPDHGRLGLFAQAAGAMREDIEDGAGESSRWAFDSWTIDGEEIWKSAHAVHVLHVMAMQTIAYSKAHPSKRGRKTSLDVFFVPMMEVYEALTGDYASVATDTETEQRYGPALDFAVSVLAMARDRLVDGALNDEAGAVPMERFRDELQETATADAIEKRFRRLNRARRTQ